MKLEEQQSPNKDKVPGRLIAELYQISDEELRPSHAIPQNWKGRKGATVTLMSELGDDITRRESYRQFP